MSKNQLKKCSKCGSIDLRKKHVRIPGSAGMFNPLEATAYICNTCGYIELYGKEKRV